MNSLEEWESYIEEYTEKLEEQAKNNFAQANRSLQEALLMQKQCENRLEAGKQTLKEAMLENLKVGQIRRREECGHFR